MCKVLHQLNSYYFYSYMQKYQLPVGIFFLTISVQLIHIGMAGWGADLQSPYPRSDAYVYIYQAWFTAFIDSSGGYAGEFMSPSLYVWLQTMAYQWLGPHYFVPLFVNSILVSFSAVFSALTARRFFGEKVGWIAGAMFTLTGPIVFFAGVTVKTNLVLFLLAMACYFAIRFFQDTRFWWAFSAVFALGLASMERHNLLLLIILLIILIIYHGWHSVSKNKLVSIVVACFSAVVLLFVVSGWSPSEAEPKLSSPIGLNFFVGNSPNSWGGYTDVEGIKDDIIGHRTEPQTLAEKALGRPLSRWDVSQYYFKKSFDYIISHPQEYITLQFRKAGLLFAQYSQGLPEQYHVWRGERAALIVAFIDTGLILVLTGFGLYYLRSKVREPGLFFLISGAILYALSVWIFFVGERYRLTLIVLIIPVAAYGVWYIFKNRSGMKLLTSVGLILILYGGTWGLNNLIPYGSGWAENHAEFLTREIHMLEKEKVNYDLMRELVNNPKLESWVEMSLLSERRGFVSDAKIFANRAISHFPEKAAGYELMLDLLDHNSTKSERSEFALQLKNASSSYKKDQKILTSLKRYIPRLTGDSM